MLPSPATISQAATLIADRLSQWAVPAGGKVEIMANQRHLWEALADLPTAAAGSPRVMVLYNGESLLAPDEPDCHRVRRDWMVIVVRGYGFKEVSERTAPGGGAYEPFTDSVERVRELIRTMTGISDLEETPNVIHTGIKPLPSALPTREASAFMDAMAVEFSTYNDIPAVTLEAYAAGETGTLPGQ
jgi:hypothetical protein